MTRDWVPVSNPAMRKWLPIAVCLLHVSLLGQRSSARLISPCGNPTVSISSRNILPRVVGGHPTTAENFPWTVVIFDLLTNHVVCGGAILTENLVLSAAHCFYGRAQANLYYMMAGKSQLLEFEAWQQLAFLDQIFLHEDFSDTTRQNDIALIKIAGSFNLQTAAVRPVCFPESSHTLAVGTMCYLAGFGDTLGTGTDQRLNYIGVPVIEDAVCSHQDFHGLDFSPSVSFCAGYANGGPDACTGDSGSALVARHSDGYFYVYGLSSWGSGCGEAGSPGVYTDVLKYVSWVYGQVIRLNVKLSG